MDKMREEFEKWAAVHYGVYSIGKVDGNYSSQKVNDSWLVWQASRAALVVDMTVHEEFDKRMYASNVYKELDKAGIKYE